eukprot:CAMPEP_0170123464 /NCGR_PEP_ID=MMETSP0020_2-20130122/17500_1 /TAXON_ID=98059 /ORGANISM="Dinobryon sp., Strain UTEXLB2267" /LENGTH=630 /DNA_ID=CAMNT_0010355017 /DNA_START=34 /DNA_END=1926 /DNA_ORIENTATION=+
MADLEEDENMLTSSSSVKKVPKKKHYPFGTPSHAHHAFSDFSHLRDTDKSFVMQLAASSVIEPEIVEEVQPKRYRKPPPKAPLNVEEDDDDIPDTEGSAPCTRPACQGVIKSIIELQYKNHIEKLEIEDEYHRLLEELMQSEQQVLAAEHKLEKLNEVGNQLELKLGQLMQNVETLEKNKENLQNERSDINNKIMVSETESHKISRKLERAQKALADAMWRKKKQDQLENVEAGLSLASSIISEQPIKQADPKDVAVALELYKTGYNKLAKVNVVDFNERQPGVKTLTPFLQEKLIYDADSLDKYSKAFFKTATSRNIHSRAGQDELELDKLDDRVVSRFKDSGINGASFFFDPMNSGLNGGDRSRPSSRLSVSIARSPAHSQTELFDRSLEGRKSRSEPLLLLPHLHLSERSTMRQALYGSRNRKQSSIGAHSLSGKMGKSGSLGRSMSDMQSSHQQHMIGLHGDSADTFGGGMGMLSRSLGEGNFNNNLLNTRGSTSSWTNGTTPMGMGLDGPTMSGSVTPSQFGRPTPLSASSQFLQPQLDPVFYKEKARAKWGRATPLGIVRVDGLLSSNSTTTSNPQSDGDKARELKMYQQIKAQCKGKLLTTRHPGMDTFHDSVTISAISITSP